MWSEGISEGSFSPKEILNEFSSRNIEIPDSLYKDFYNQIFKKMKI